MRLLRNIFRRKLRAFLTIFGIAIGVLALVVMGAIAEKLTLLVAGGTTYYEGKVVVSGEGGIAGIGSGLLSTNQMREIEQVSGVARVSATVSGLFDENPPAVNFGTISTFQATDGRDKGFEKFIVTVKAGRDIQNKDRGLVVLGSDLADTLQAGVGDKIEIHDEKFTVVGVWNKTLTAPDNAAAVSMHDAQRLVYDALPGMQRKEINPNTIVSSFVVYPSVGVDAQALAGRIERNVAGVAAMGPDDFEAQVTAPLAVFTSVIYAIAIVSLLVGGLSVINTMTMSVSERTREIGVRKAIGASNAQIMGQFISEAGVIGFIGGLAGLGLGWLIAEAGNAAGQASGNALFLLTPRLAIGSLVFAVVLGIVSGLYPASHAAGLNPVEALRYE
jgi:putative ABC transport system permease protein